MIVAELIRENDTLNQGRKKINDAITQSNIADSRSQFAFNIANQALEQSKNTQQQLDQIVIEGDSSVEAAQARVDADGNTFTTLKERLDTKETQFASQLAQTKEDLEQRSVNVKWFGAKGDGITDDTSSINTAIEYAKQNRRSVYFPSGEYLVSRVNGTEYCLILDHIENMEVVFDDAKIIGDIDISDGNINILYILNCENVTIRNAQIDVTLFGDPQETVNIRGIYVSGAGSQERLNNVNLDGCKGTVAHVSGDIPGINHYFIFYNSKSILDCNSTISNCLIDKQCGRAIQLNRVKKINVINNKITDLGLKGGEGVGIRLANGCENILIDENTITSASDINYPIVLLHFEDGADHLLNKNIIVTNNILDLKTDNVAFGIGLQIYGVNNLIVSNNKFIQSETYQTLPNRSSIGVRFRNPHGIDNFNDKLLFTNNYFSGWMLNIIRNESDRTQNVLFYNNTFDKSLNNDTDIVSHNVDSFDFKNNWFSSTGRWGDGLRGNIHKYSTAMPTEGEYKVGDFIQNVNTFIEGSPPNRYIIRGWIRTTNGSAHQKWVDWWEIREYEPR